MNKVTVYAYAKINLFLDIKDIRDDGYHDLEMVMQSIKLHDRIILTPSQNGITLTTDSHEIPTDDKNLAHKAAEAVIEKTGLKKGVNIHIDKNIPIAAGLAGGSTDAAAVLKGMNNLFELTLDDGLLHEIAAEIGSDVPFCLKGGTAFATGRGDKLNQLPPLKKKGVILVKPPQMVSTKEIYQLYDKQDINLEVPVQKLLKIIKNQKELEIKDGWANVLEPVTRKIVDDLTEIKSRLIEQGFDFTMMTGSGPTVFSLIDKSQVKKAQEVIKDWDRPQDDIMLTETLNRDEFTR